LTRERRASKGGMRAERAEVPQVKVNSQVTESGLPRPAKRTE